MPQGFVTPEEATGQGTEREKTQAISSHAVKEGNNHKGGKNRIKGLPGRPAGAMGELFTLGWEREAPKGTDSQRNTNVKKKRGD